MADISDGANWSETDAANNRLSPNGWPEGMMPSGVNDAARADKGALKRFWNRANPITNTFDVMVEARAHWADHCANCHANDGSGDTEMGRHLYPPAPDMRLPETQNLTDGELFYIIQNGVRLTGMPAWGSGAAHDEEASWKLVHFIRHLPQLSFQEKKEMESLNPKTPDELKEEQEEENFLKGEDDPHAAHHHH